MRSGAPGPTPSADQWPRRQGFAEPPPCLRARAAQGRLGSRGPAESGPRGKQGTGLGSADSGDSVALPQTQVAFLFSDKDFGSGETGLKF